MTNDQRLMTKSPERAIFIRNGRERICCHRMCRVMSIDARGKCYALPQQMKNPPGAVRESYWRDLVNAVGTKIRKNRGRVFVVKLGFCIK